MLTFCCFYMKIIICNTFIFFTSFCLSFSLPPSFSPPPFPILNKKSNNSIYCNMLWCNMQIKCIIKILKVHNLLGIVCAFHALMKRFIPKISQYYPPYQGYHHQLELLQVKSKCFPIKVLHIMWHSRRKLTFWHKKMSYLYNVVALTLLYLLVLVALQFVLLFLSYKG